MQQQHPLEPPINSVSAEALDELRETRLDLTERLLCRLPAGTRHAEAARVHSFVQTLLAHLGDESRASDTDLTANAVDSLAYGSRWEACDGKLHADVIFVHGSGIHRPATDDAAAIDALSDELSPGRLGGGYLTALYKGVPDSSQGELAALLGSDHPGLLLDVMLELLHEEIAVLRGPIRPVIACPGEGVDASVRPHFEPLGYRVVHIPQAGDGASPIAAAERASARELFTAALSHTRAHSGAEIGVG